LIWNKAHARSRGLTVKRAISNVEVFQMVSLTAVTALVVAAGLLGGLLLTGRRLLRAAGRNEPLLLQQVLERRGARLDTQSDPMLLAESGRAARRCLLCRDRGECVEWLEGRSERALAEFCPNAQLLARMNAGPD
jgi:hypothetical protein